MFKFGGNGIKRCFRERRKRKAIHFFLPQNVQILSPFDFKRVEFFISP